MRSPFRRLKNWQKLGLALALALLAGPPLLVETITQFARTKANRLMSELAGETEQETIFNVAKWANTSFEVTAKYPWLLGNLPRLYYGDEPRFLRFPLGTLDFLILAGQCSDLSRALAFMFKNTGFKVIQHDIVAPSTGHSVLSIKTGRRWVFIDPLLGYVFREQGELISFSRLQWLAARGRSPSEFAVRLPRVVDTEIYQRETLAAVGHARLGEPLRFRVALPGTPARLSIGNRDAGWDDVYTDGTRQQLTSYLWFIGPRYFPTDFRPRFVRSDATGDVGFRITFYLLDSLPPDDLPKANLPAEHDGNILRYTVADGAEGLSLDYSAMRRWYGVDQIEVEPL